MTSGQGGHDPQQGQPPQGQPGWQTPPQQGWQSPPPQQGWQSPTPSGWQPPQQGWNDPQQGWQGQPLHGWPGAPSGPGQQLPQEAPPRPDAVRFGLGAYVAQMLLGLVGAVVGFVGFDAIADEQLAGTGVEFSEDILGTLAIGGLVIGLLYAALRAVFIFFAWRGHNWARIVLFVLGGITILSGLLSLGQPSTGFLTALAVFQTLLVVVGIVLLTRPPANEWYRAMTARRQAGLR